MVLVVLLVLSQESFTAVFIVNALLGVVSVAFRSAYIRKITDLYEAEQQRHQVNALLNSGSYIAMGLGSIAGAALISQWSLTICLWIDAAEFLISALFLYHLQPDQGIGKEEQKKSSTFRQMISALVREVRGSVAFVCISIWSELGGCRRCFQCVVSGTIYDSGGKLRASEYFLYRSGFCAVSWKFYCL
ncbi:MFS transporter [Vibrio sp. PP-XX7]